ncbi:MAG: ribulose-phosphate 3-epimerase [Planctomycetaceae bacterium]|nr:ribulose-phosphate 3-epimerase [Planctomycetaceae bacterium]
MRRSETLRGLGKSSAVIAPSLLKCNYAQLERQLGELEQAGMEVLHLDVMDGHFVPNLSYGPMVIESLRKVCSVPFDAHLMISDPAKYLNDYISAGCDGITFHIEAVPEPIELLKRIRAAGLVAGLALNPGTPVERISSAIQFCDYILVMSVEPGFGGQKFMPVALEKLRQVRELVSPGTLVGVDGGIGPKTIGDAASAGANLFVVGSALFDLSDYSEGMRQLMELAGRKPLQSLHGVK